MTSINPVDWIVFSDAHQPEWNNTLVRYDAFDHPEPTHDCYINAMNQTIRANQERHEHRARHLTKVDEFVYKNFYTSWLPSITSGNHYNYRYGRYSRYFVKNTQRIPEQAWDPDNYGVLRNYYFSKNDDIAIFKIDGTDTWIPANFPENQQYDQTDYNYCYVTEMTRYEENGKVFYSKLPKNIIDYFGDCIDLSSLKLSHRFLDLDQQISARQSYNSRTDKYRGWKNTKYLCSQLGDITFLSGEENLKLAHQSEGNAAPVTWDSVLASTTGHINVISLQSLYRGGGGKVSYEKKRKRISTLFVGKNIFLYSSKFTILNQDTFEWEEVDVINMMVTVSLEQAFKYKRANAFFPELFKNLFTKDGMMFTNPSEYYRLIKEKFGLNANYWNGIHEIFQESGVDVTSLSDVDYENYLTNNEPVFDKDIVYLQHYNTISNNDSVAVFNQASKRKKSIEEAIVSSKLTVESSTRAVESTKERIAQYQAYIDDFEKDIATNLKNKKEAESKIEGLTPALDELSKAIDELSKENDQAIENLFNDDISEVPNFIENLTKSGIIIDEIEYIIPGLADLIRDDFSKWDENQTRIWTEYDSQELAVEDLALISIKQDPKIALMARLGRSWYDNCPNLDNAIQNRTNSQSYRLFPKEDFIPKIHKIQFHTLKPVVIRVDYGRDGDNCKKVVGGPYKVEITYTGYYYNRNKNSYNAITPTLNISLASTDACFGKDSTGKMWVHPHTNYFTYSTDSWENFKSLFKTVGSACLGEAHPGLFSAYEKSDAKSAIFSAMTWITSANSSDTWGRNYCKFPKLSEVNIEGTPEEIQTEPESPDADFTSEETMDNIVEDLGLALEEACATELTTVAEEQPTTNFIQANIEIPTVAETTDECVVDHHEDTNEVMDNLSEQMNPPTLLADVAHAVASAYRQLPEAADTENTTTNQQQELRSAGVTDYVSYATIRAERNN